MAVPFDVDALAGYDSEEVAAQDACDAISHISEDPFIDIFTASSFAAGSSSQPPSSTSRSPRTPARTPQGKKGAAKKPEPVKRKTPAARKEQASRGPHTPAKRKRSGKSDEEIMGESAPPAKRRPPPASKTTKNNSNKSSNKERSTPAKAPATPKGKQPTVALTTPPRAIKKETTENDSEKEEEAEETSEEEESENEYAKQRPPKRTSTRNLMATFGEVDKRLPRTKDGEFEVSRIISHRLRGGKVEYKVLWKYCGPDYATWEPAEHLANAFEAVVAYEAEYNSGQAAREAGSDSDE